MLLVMQMQGADFDYTNTDSYGHSPPAATPASGYTALNTTGRYEYVMATSGVTAGAVSISGLGAGSGLIYDYTTAAATASAGQRRFQVHSGPSVHDGIHQQRTDRRRVERFGGRRPCV